MKKQIIILFLLILSFPSWGQKTIKTDVPCNDEVLFKTPGRWIKSTGAWQPGHIGLNTSQQQEVSNRVDLIHQMIMKIYPQPTGLDAVWWRTLGYSTFADKVKFVRNSQGDFERETIIEKPVAGFGYASGFFRHYCNVNNPHEIWPGYPGETGTFVNVYANNFRQATAAAQQYYEGHMAIDGYRVQLLQPLNKDLGGFKMLGIENAVLNTGSSRYVLVHRKGMVPYIPVTRKQYLDQCIPEVTRFWNESIKSVEQMPVRSLAEQEAEKKATIAKMEKDFAWNPNGLKAAVDYYLSGYKTEQEIRDEQVKKLKKEKDEVLSLYREELEKTTKDGLLDAPAIVQSMCNSNPDNSSSIFVNETEGWMLVIENPDYMRKDLPKYVPQFFTVVWRWNDWPPQAEIAKLMEEKFPFEKLREMIDK